MIAADFVNPCGGTKWRTLADGRIQLQDGTIPAFSAASPQYALLSQTWANWSPEFRAASSSVGVPTAWLVAIATSETGAWAKDPERQRTIASTDGYSSVGIMQPIPSVASMFGYSANDRYDPLKNIEMGAKLLLQDATQTKNGPYGFPVVAAMYNGGSGSGGCNIGNDTFNLKGYKGAYATNAIKYLNAAIEAGMDEKMSPVAMGAVLALMGMGVATAIWVARRN